MKTLTKLFRNLVLIICSLFWLSNVQAQSKGENIFIIHDAVGQPDSIITIYVEIINQDYFLGFQFDLPLPAGFSYVSGSAWLNPARKIVHLINGDVLPGTNTLRIISFALGGGYYLGNNGIIATFGLNNTAQIANYQLISENVIIGNAQNQNIVTGTIHGTVNIMPGGKVSGDSNCDGVVNVMDVINTVSYITGNIPPWFCFQNTDLDGNLLVNVADVVGTVNIILSGSK